MTPALLAIPAVTTVAVMNQKSPTGQTLTTSSYLETTTNEARLDNDTIIANLEASITTNLKTSKNAALYTDVLTKIRTINATTVSASLLTPNKAAIDLDQKAAKEGNLRTLLNSLATAKVNKAGLTGTKAVTAKSDYMKALLGTAYATSYKNVETMLRNYTSKEEAKIFEGTMYYLEEVDSVTLTGATTEAALAEQFIQKFLFAEIPPLLEAVKNNPTARADYLQGFEIVEGLLLRNKSADAIRASLTDLVARIVPESAATAGVDVMAFLKEILSKTQVKSIFPTAANANKQVNFNDVLDIAENLQIYVLAPFLKFLPALTKGSADATRINHIVPLINESFIDHLYVTLDYLSIKSKTLGAPGSTSDTMGETLVNALISSISKFKALI